MQVNRKGHIPTLLLFPIALVLIIGALVSFVSFSGSRSDDASRFALFAAEMYEDEAYAEALVKGFVDQAHRDAFVDSGEFEAAFDESLKEHARILSEDISFNGDLVAKLRAGEYVLVPDGEFYRFEVVDVSIRTRVGVHESVVHRDFVVRFKRGEVGKVYK